jgi:hypothetical protein
VHSGARLYSVSEERHTLKELYFKIIDEARQNEH